MRHDRLSDGNAQLRESASIINPFINYGILGLGQLSFELGIDDVRHISNGKVAVQIEHLNTDAVIEEALKAIGIGTIEVNATTLNVGTGHPAIGVNVGRDAINIFILFTTKGDHLVIVDINAVTHHLDVEGIAVDINGGQSERQITMSTLISTVIPGYIGWVGRH